MTIGYEFTSSSVAAARKSLHGRKVIAEGVTLEQFQRGAMDRTYPEGARLVAILGVVVARSNERKSK